MPPRSIHGTRENPMSRTRLLSAAILLMAVFAGTAVAAETILLLPFSSFDVGAPTVEAARAFLAGELEVRDHVVLRPDDHPACDRIDCARAACAAAAAEKVAYGSLIRLGPKIAVHLAAARAGEESPFFLDQLTASDEGALDEALRAMAAAIDREDPRADRSRFESRSMLSGVVPAGGPSRPRLGFHAGLLFPTGESYGGVDRMVNLRLALQNELPAIHVEMTLPMAGLAWSGHLGESWDDEGAVDWTLFDIFAGPRVDRGRQSFHLGVGVGLHHVRIDSSPCIYRPEGLAVDCSHGDDETTALTGDLGGGARILGDGTNELNFILRYHHVFVDVGGEEGAHGIYFGFSAVL